MSADPNLEVPMEYKPGVIVQASGIYETTGGRQATLSKGDRFPPTAAEATWKVVRLAKTSSRGRATRAQTRPDDHKPALLDALKEVETLRRRVAGLEAALRNTDALMWEWGGETGHDEEPDGTWRPEWVRERHVTNGLLLAAREVDNEGS